jgi:hypothetical protein
MLRLLNSAELPLCIEGGHEFFAEGKMPGGFNPQVFLEHWRGFLESGRGYMIGLWKETDLAGVMGFVLAPDMWNGDTMAIECLWYVRKQHRGGPGAMRLLFEFEKQAKRLGAVRTALIHLESLTPVELESVYLKRGYVLVEKHYVKTL